MPIVHKKKSEMGAGTTGSGAVPPSPFPPDLPPVLHQLTEALTQTQAVLLHYKPVIGETTTEVKQNKQVVHEATDTEVVGHVPAIGPMCQVGVEASNTINLGNFNSMRVGVSITIPCAYKEIQKTYELAQGWVNAKMEELQEQVNESGG